ncbi:MAG: spore coat protein [Firmicutes bacterium]|nr:spore coat protein [Bacillota bacterium]
MMVQLTQKERLLLEDQKAHEELCILKYRSYAEQAKDAQLQQLFTSYAGQEQQHLDTINQVLAGQQPAMSPGQQQQEQQGQPAPGGSLGKPLTADAQNDTALCQDMLSTEKYISATYNTAIFEMTDANIRQALNHIQKEEQQHGEGIFNYMQSKGYYQPK